MDLGKKLKLQEEYLGYVLEEGFVYSLPSGGVLVASEASAVAGRVFFRVVHSRPGHQKGTTAKAAGRHGGMRMALQWFEEWVAPEAVRRGP